MGSVEGIFRVYRHKKYNKRVAALEHTGKKDPARFHADEYNYRHCVVGENTTPMFGA